LLALEMRKTESNEQSWWSKWVEETVWITQDAYALFSKQFKDEYFFNHGGFLDAEKDAEAIVGALEKEFGGRKLPVACVFVQDGRPWEKIRRSVISRGYKVDNVMSVMEFVRRKPVTPNPDVRITILGSSSHDKEIREWSGAYLEAFYGGKKLLEIVQGIMRKAIEDAGTSLILARIKQTVVGCAALYRTDDLAGAYCIGTVPDFRKRGVGATMLDSMIEIAAREKRRLILQTLLSDSAEGFYLKQGFKRAYSKDIFVRRQSGSGVR
jgi:N-acetylglutamate synthase-like GNAT family acetyltransferase